ncbi:pilus assembly protein PilM, partial [Nodularia sphaerocarpa]
MVKSINNLLTKFYKGVGIELAPERVNVVQLRKQRQGLKLQSLTSVPVPEGVIIDGQIIDISTMAELIQQALAQSK